MGAEPFYFYLFVAQYEPAPNRTLKVSLESGKQGYEQQGIAWVKFK